MRTQRSRSNTVLPAESWLSAWGRFVHRRRWLVLVGSLVLLAITGIGVVDGGSLSSITFSDVGTPAQRADDLIQQEIPTHKAQVGSSFDLLLHDSRCRVAQPECRASFLRALQPLRHDSTVTGVVTPYSTAPAQAAELTSAGGHTALVVVQVSTSIVAAAGDYPHMLRQVRDAAPAGVGVKGTGQVEVEYALLAQLHSDLGRAESISLPLSLLLLAIIFGSVVSALLPLGAGSLAILAGSGCALLLSRHFQVTQYAPDVVTLIGLGVSIDYSLFITTRFRDELARGETTEQAVATALGTSGRAVVFSGITVAAGLCSLLFFAGTLAPSAGIAGALAVIAAVILALTFLPALLSILGPRIDFLRLPLRAGSRSRGRIWRWLGIHVARRPFAFLLPTVAVLLLAGVPFLNVHLAAAGIDQLPPGSPARVNQATLTRDFPAQNINTTPVVVYYGNGDPLSARRVDALYTLSRRLARLPGVQSVSGPLDISPRLGRADYVRLLSAPPARQPASVRTLLAGSTGRHIVVMNVNTEDGVNSPGAQALVADLRAETVPGGTVMIGGQTALNEDVVQYIVDRLPFAAGAIVLISLLILFVLTQSIVIPIKAVLSNAVSICASFGALVWIFQEGHLSGILGFTPQPIDPSILVLLFAAVFGLSMDYEVLLVSRIQETYLKTGNNTFATVRGLQRSGSLITGAAAIMIAVFAAFTTADMVILKAIGLGLALAIGIDATLVRAIVVPSVMRLLGPVNWWAPAPLRRLLPEIRLEGAAPGFTAGLGGAPQPAYVQAVSPQVTPAGGTDTGETDSGPRWTLGPAFALPALLLLLVGLSGEAKPALGPVVRAWRGSSRLGPALSQRVRHLAPLVAGLRERALRSPDAGPAPAAEPVASLPPAFQRAALEPVTPAATPGLVTRLARTPGASLSRRLPYLAAMAVAAVIIGSVVPLHLYQVSQETAITVKPAAPPPLHVSRSGGGGVAPRTQPPLVAPTPRANPVSPPTPAPAPAVGAVPATPAPVPAAPATPVPVPAASSFDPAPAPVESAPAPAAPRPVEPAPRVEPAFTPRAPAEPSFVPRAPAQPSFAPRTPVAPAFAPREPVRPEFDPPGPARPGPAPTFGAGFRPNRFGR